MEWVEDIRLLDPPGTNDRVPFFIAHEFFDSLPIHAFQTVVQPAKPSVSKAPTDAAKAGRPESPRPTTSQQPPTVQWRELVVAENIKADPSNPDSQEPEFQLSVAKASNPNSLIIPETSSRYKKLKTTPNSYIEVSPESQKYIQDIAQHIQGRPQPSSSSTSASPSRPAKGAALLIDYGPSTSIPHSTLRGIKSHTLVSPFLTPGQTDVSADVDFTALADAALQISENIEVYGPVEQGSFLLSLGIEDRAKQLLSHLTTTTATTDDKELEQSEQKRKGIESSVKRLVEGSQSGGMGSIYKVMAVVPESGGKRRPVGFGGDVVA